MWLKVREIDYGKLIKNISLNFLAQVHIYVLCMKALSRRNIKMVKLLYTEVKRVRGYKMKNVLVSSSDW